MNSKSLIDNWSLQHAALLLDNSYDHEILDNQQFMNSIGGLSNYINSLLIYSDVNYPANGFERAWINREWFALNTKAYIKPLNTEETLIKWDNEKSYEDNGIQNYLITSEYYNCDLFISPERASIVKTNIESYLTDNHLTTTLKKIDERINLSRKSTWYKDINIGISNNFVLPSLTQYVLNEASSMEDLLTVIMQLKSSGRIESINQKISDITSSTKGSFKFQKDIENIIDKNFGNIDNKNKDWSISVTAVFLSLSKSFDLDFFNRNEHLVFLKDIIKCRAEVNSLEKDIQRIFKRRIL